MQRLARSSKASKVRLTSPRKAGRPMSPLPKLVAFDLDATLWYPEMDMTYGPPFNAAKNGRVKDKRGEEIELMGASWGILNQLATDPAWQNTSVAYVSRTCYPEWAKACLKVFQVADGVSMHNLAPYQEIYPGNKRTHFQAIHQESGIAFKDMIFFDNERRNIVDCSPLGITCVYTPHGMTEEAWTKGLEAFATAHAS